MKRSLILLSLALAAITAHGQGDRRADLNFGGNYLGGNSWFSAQGRWAGGDPSETQLNCDRKTHTCTASTATLYLATPHISLEDFEVAQWDQNGLVAVDVTGSCMKRTMVITFANRSILVYGAIKNLTKETAEACATMDASQPYTDRFVVKDSPEWKAAPYGVKNWPRVLIEPSKNTEK